MGYINPKPQPLNPALNTSHRALWFALRRDQYGNGTVFRRQVGLGDSLQVCCRDGADAWEVRLPGTPACHDLILGQLSGQIEYRILPEQESGFDLILRLLQFPVWNRLVLDTRT